MVPSIRVCTHCTFNLLTTHYCTDLSHLCEENKYLVACFCSSCDESETNEDLDSAIERLYKSEESSNTAAFTCEKLINDYNDPGQIKSRNGHIWGSYYFTESTGMMYEELRAFRKIHKKRTSDMQIWSPQTISSLFLLSCWKRMLTMNSSYTFSIILLPPFEIFSALLDIAI